MIAKALWGGRTAKGKSPDIAAGPNLLTLDNPAGWLLAQSGETSSPQEAMKLSAVYRAVDYICDFVASLPTYVYDRDNRERVKAHYLSPMLGLRPNPYQTPADFKRLRVRQLLLRGNSYAYIHRDSRTGRPMEMIPLEPECMQLLLLDGELCYLYSHPNSGRLYRLDPQDVSHYKGPSEDGYTGESVLKYAARTLAVAKSGAEYEAAVYNRGAHPSGVLSTDTDLGGDSERRDPDNPERFLSKKENIRRAWEAVHGGASNAFRTAVLDNGLKYQPIAMSSFDAQFIAARSVTVEDIARFFGVPLHALMTGKQSYASNEQNSLEFIQGKGLALLRMMEEEDSYKLLLGSDLSKNYWIKRNFDARLRGDTAARANYYRTMRDIGAMSVNDILALEDLPKVEGGDVRMASLNYVPLDRFEELSVARNKAMEPGDKAM